MTALAGGGLWAWSPTAGWTSRQDAGNGRLHVVDSWLVDDGRVRASQLHDRRFSASCLRRGGVDRATLAGFLSAVRRVVPLRGRWWPRIEYLAGTEPELQLRLRPAPPPAGPVVLSVAGVPDPRRYPRVKGPDLQDLGELRERAVDGGADEALLLAADGTVLECAFSSVLWWEGDRLCLPDDRLPILPGVTRQLLLDLAAAGGQEVRPRRCSIDALDRAETWVVSALHGIRPVAGWVGVPLVPGPPLRAARWQCALLALARPFASSLEGSGALWRISPTCRTNPAR